MIYPGDLIIKNFRRSVKGALTEGPLWENARFLLADVPLKAKEVKKILPLGIRPSDPPVATLFIVDYKKTAFTVPYMESACLIHVRTLLGEGLHCCWMTVDDDTAMIYGRELLGYPKKNAEIAFEESDDSISASVTRRGVQVLTMEGKRGPTQTSPTPIFDVKTFNAGGMGQFMAANLVWLLRPLETIHESYDAEVSLTLEESEYDPLARLVAGGPTNGRIAVIDIITAKYIMPFGIAGPLWFKNTFSMRFR